MTPGNSAEDKTLTTRKIAAGKNTWENRDILYSLCQAFILCFNYNYLNTLPTNKYTTPVSTRLKISAYTLANK